jgi:hypothetical protein
MKAVVYSIAIKNRRKYLIVELQYRRTSLTTFPGEHRPPFLPGR